MNKATMGLVVTCASLFVGFVRDCRIGGARLSRATNDGVILLAQTLPQADPAEVAPRQHRGPGLGSAVSPTGGRPVPVDPAEVRRDNTRDPNSAPGASTTGGRPVPVDPAEVRRDDTRDPG